MQRIGVVQIGKIPSSSEYQKWLIATNYKLSGHQNNNLIVFWGKDGKPEIIYQSN